MSERGTCANHPVSLFPTAKRKADTEEDDKEAKKPKPASVKPLKTATELTANPPSNTLWGES